MVKNSDEILSLSSISELEELSRLSDKNVLKKFSSLFLKEVPKKLRALESSLQKNRFDEFHKMAHALKSDCIVIGAKKMEGLCKEMLFSSQQQNKNALVILVEQINIAFVDTTAALRTCLDIRTDCARADFV